MHGVLGRTNRAFPGTWLGLMSPPPDAAPALVERALAAQVPLEISSNPALWGGLMRGTEATVAVTVGRNLATCDRAETANDMIMGELLQFLSCIGRDRLDIVFLRLDRRLEEFQINGALEALELNCEDGMISHLGVACYGRAFATLAMWQFHDAFDLILMPRNPRQTEPYEMLSGLARERRVGVVTCGSIDWGDGPVTDDLPTGGRLVCTYRQDHPVLVGVRTPAEIDSALAEATPMQISELEAVS
ncbi:MAG: hypothetical protein JNJ45_04070 [Chthonomonas sp.]|nr:hypothetical protein [Chthonomonas sp.]